LNVAQAMPVKPVPTERQTCSRHFAAIAPHGLPEELQSPVPKSHTSTPVQVSPSSQSPWVLHGGTHGLIGSAACSSQTKPLAAQSGGAAGVHVSAWHVSAPLQRTPSSQSPRWPSGTGS
jgi:hypothetical protein